MEGVLDAEAVWVAVRVAMGGAEGAWEGEEGGVPAAVALRLWLWVCEDEGTGREAQGELEGEEV